MSAFVLRPGFKRSLCSSCLHFPNSRSYVSAAFVCPLPRPSTHDAHSPEPHPVAGPSCGVSLTLPETPLPNGKMLQWSIDPNTPASANGRKRRKASNVQIPNDLDTDEPPQKLKKRKKVPLLRRNLLDPTKVEEYLAFVKATKTSVTLEDIERCQPRTHGPPGSQKYETDYNALLDTLVRSFSTKQLRTFVRLYSLQPHLTHSKRTKWDYAVSIMEQQWNWPSLTEIQKEQRDWTEVTYKTFPLNPRQSFLILGTDGADLLSLSIQYDVHITFSSNPLSMKVEGVRGKIDKLSDHIEELKNEIQEETFKLPREGPIRKDLLQRISRLAGAFTENFGNDIVRISFKRRDPHTLLIAKRLVTRAICEVQEFTAIPILSYIPPVIPNSTPVPTSMFPHTYSLYPFLSPRSLPWSMNTRGAFRIRRVGEWLGGNTTEDVQKTGGLSEGRGRVVTMDGKPGDIKAVLLRHFPEPATDLIGSSRVATASLGHVLLTSPPAQRATIVPPLKGYWQLPKILKWMHDHPIKQVFTPSLPAPLLDSPPTQQRILHRLVYHAIPTSTIDAVDDNQPSTRPIKVIKFEIILSPPKHPTRRNIRDESNLMDGNRFAPGTVPNVVEEQTEWDHLAPGNEVKDPSEGLLSEEAPFEGISTDGLNIRLAHRCWSGSEATLDLMIPDRPMDIRFSVFDSVVMPIEQWPTGLQKYLSDLQFFMSYTDHDATQPDTPLTLIHQNVTFVLHSSSSVRQSVEKVSIYPAIYNPRKPIQAITESILDLEGNQKSAVCQVKCDDLASEASWRSFLNSCDWLTAMKYRPVSSSVAGSIRHETDLSGPSI